MSANGRTPTTRRLRALLRLTGVLCLVLLLLGCTSGVPAAPDASWAPVSVADLATDSSWGWLAGVRLEEGVLIIGSDDEYRVLTNQFGPYLVVDGDFEVSAVLETSMESLAALSLIGRLPTGDWWVGTQRLDAGLATGQVVVSYFDGTGFLPRLSRTFDVPGLGREATLGIRSVDEILIVTIDGREVGGLGTDLRRADAFPDGIAYLGASVRPQNALRIHELTLSAPVDGSGNVDVVVTPASARPASPDMPLRAFVDGGNPLIGTAVDALALRTDPDYSRLLAREFSSVTTENALKFEPVHPEPGRYDFADADAIVDFAQAEGMNVRGHTLVWHQQVPSWISQGSYAQAEWEQILHDHITTVVSRYRGRVQVWDVVNEGVAESGASQARHTVWLEHLGPGYMDRAFQWAHEADPDALLFYNDFGAEGMGGKSDRVYDLVRGMVERGVPIDGVGLQMHIVLDSAPDPSDVRANMNRLEALGLQVHITEMDIRLPTDPGLNLLDRQAAIYREMLSVCLEAGNCTAFIMWGLDDGHSWIPDAFPGYGNALIFDADYEPKPAYAMMHALLGSMRSADLPALIDLGDKVLGPGDYGAECDCGE